MPATDRASEPLPPTSMPATPSPTPCSTPGHRPDDAPDRLGHGAGHGIGPRGPARIPLVHVLAGMYPYAEVPVWWVYERLLAEQVGVEHREIPDAGSSAAGTGVREQALGLPEPLGVSRGGVSGASSGARSVGRVDGCSGVLDGRGAELVTAPAYDRGPEDPGAATGEMPAQSGPAHPAADRVTDGAENGVGVRWLSTEGYGARRRPRRGADWVRDRCAQGLIPGARKEGGVWLIPTTALAPAAPSPAAAVGDSSPEFDGADRNGADRNGADRNGAADSAVGRDDGLDGGFGAPDTGPGAPPRRGADRPRRRPPATPARDRMEVHPRW